MSKEKEDEEESVLKVSGKLKVRTKATYCRYGRDPRKVWNGRVIGLRAITWTLGQQARANMVARLLVMRCGSGHGANDDPSETEHSPELVYCTAQWEEADTWINGDPGPRVDRESPRDTGVPRAGSRRKGGEELYRGLSL